MIKGVYGLNIAVKDLDEAVQKFEGLFGMKPTKMMGDGDFAFPGLKGALFDVNGFMLHLVTSTNDETSIAKFLNSKGDGVFLLSLRSDNVQEDSARIAEAGFKFVLEKPLSGQFGTVNFIHPKSANGVQMEVYDPDSQS